MRGVAAIRVRLFSDLAVYRLYSSTHKLFKTQHVVYLGVVLLLRKLLLSACSLFFERKQLAQGLMFALVITGGGLAMSNAMPYYHKLYSRLELLFTCTLSAAVVAQALRFWLMAADRYLEPGPAGTVRLCCEPPGCPCQRLSALSAGLST